MGSPLARANFSSRGGRYELLLFENRLLILSEPNKKIIRQMEISDVAFMVSNDDEPPKLMLTQANSMITVCTFDDREARNYCFTQGMDAAQSA